MSRLLYTIIRTTRLDEMKAFYGGRLGLETAASGPGGVEYRTRGATLALHAVTDPGVAGIALRFATPDLQAECARLEARGIPVGAGITDQPAGRLAEFRDPEDNLVGLLQPQAPRVETEGPTLGAAIVNCRDFGRAASFYRDRLGLPVAAEGLHWVGVDNGETRVPRAVCFFGASRSAPTASRLTAFEPFLSGLRMPSCCGTSSSSKASASNSSTVGSPSGWRNTMTLPSGSTASA